MAFDPIYTRSVVRISGEDAHKLLADTLTCRFDASLKGVGRWFALLSPQGKVQVEGLVTEDDGAFWFDVDREAATEFVRRMKLYRLRAKVEIEMPDCLVLWSPEAGGETGAGIIYRDERSPKLGNRKIVPRTAEIAPNEDALIGYHALRIAEGVPELGADFAANEMFAHDIGLDLLGGIDFVKGCYIGQEVVSRMKHRGTARRRPVIASGVTGSAGSAVSAGGREAGTVGLVVGGRAVGIVRLDRIVDPADVLVGGAPARLALPGYATYQFGETADAEES